MKWRMNRWPVPWPGRVTHLHHLKWATHISNRLSDLFWPCGEITGSCRCPQRAPETWPWFKDYRSLESPLPPASPPRIQRNMSTTAAVDRKQEQQFSGLAHHPSRWLIPLLFSVLLLLSASLFLFFPSPSYSVSQISSSFAAHDEENSDPPLFVEEELRFRSPRPIPSPNSLPKLAYLISGSSGDGKSLKRTLRALYHPQNSYVVHLDLEASAAERLELAAAVRDDPVYSRFGNVRVIVRSNLVTYRGPTMVANTLHAAAVLLRHGGDWDWFVNLSTSDYPLVTQEGKTEKRIKSIEILEFAEFEANLVEQIYCTLCRATRDTSTSSSTRATSVGKSTLLTFLRRARQLLSDVDAQVPSSHAHYRWPRPVHLAKVRHLLGLREAKPAHGLQTLHRYEQKKLFLGRKYWHSPTPRLLQGQRGWCWRGSSWSTACGPGTISRGRCSCTTPTSSHLRRDTSTPSSATPPSSATRRSTTTCTTSPGIIPRSSTRTSSSSPTSPKWSPATPHSQGSSRKTSRCWTGSTPSCSSANPEGSRRAAGGQRVPSACACIRYRRLHPSLGPAPAPREWRLWLTGCCPRRDLMRATADKLYKERGIYFFHLRERERVRRIVSSPWTASDTWPVARVHRLFITSKIKG